MGYTGQGIGNKPFDVYDKVEVDAVKDNLQSQINNKPISVVTSVLLNDDALALADTTPTKNFAVVTYTGTGAAQDIVTGIDSVDFTVANNGSGYWFDRANNAVKDDAGNIVESGQCDWGAAKGVSKVHIKNRTTAQSNNVYDGLRGVDKAIFTESTSAEVSYTDRLTAFTSTGISLGAGGLSNDGDNYILYQTLYTHIKWGKTSHNKLYIEAYNPVTKEGMVYYIGSGQVGHQIPHSVEAIVGYYDTKNIGQSVNWGSFISGKYTGNLNLDTALNNYPDANDETEDSILINSNWNGVNSANDAFILYYKAKAATWIAGTYIGTGAAGNFVETKDVNGVARKPVRVIIKKVDGTGDWVVVDLKRPRSGYTTNYYSIVLNSANAEALNWNTSPGLVPITFDLTGFTIGVDGGDHSQLVHYNESKAQYLYMVEFDTNGAGDGSYFDYPTDGTNVNINNGIFQFVKGKTQAGYDFTTQQVQVGSIDFTGASDGIKWVARKEDGTYAFFDKKPAYETYEKEYADDNRLILKNGKWYSTTGGELVTNGTFDVDTTGWIAGNGASLSVENGQLKVTGSTTDYPFASQDITAVSGKKYRISGIANGIDAKIEVSGAVYLGNNVYLADSDIITVRLIIDNVTDNSEAYFDNISVYKLEPTLDQEQPPLSFIKHPIVVASETPQLIEYTQTLAENMMNDTYIKGTLEVTGNITAPNLLGGEGYKWVNETANRAKGVTYVNTTGKPIMVTVSGSADTWSYMYFYVDGMVIQAVQSRDADTTSSQPVLTAIVPAGSTYKVVHNSSASGQIAKWYELK